jgi:hypothetical protein
MKGFQRAGDANVNTRLLDTRGSYESVRETREEEFSATTLYISIYRNPTLWPSLFFNLRFIVLRHIIGGWMNDNYLVSYY